MGATRKSTAAADIPRDEMLVGLADLLDPSWARRVLEPHVQSIDDCRITYVRYKPGTNCIVTYAVRCRVPGEAAPAERLFYGKCYVDRDFANALDKAQEREWVSVPHAPPFVAVPERHAVIYAFPNDRELVGLPLVSHPKKMQRILYEHWRRYPGDEWRISDRRIQVTPVRYKPEKRAVVRIDTRVVHRERRVKHPVTAYLRVYDDDRGRVVFDDMQALHAALGGEDRVAVPEPIVYLADKNAIVIEGVGGDPLLGRLAGSGAVEAVRRTADALAAIHRTGRSQTRRSASDLMEDARATGRTLARIVPAIEKPVSRILSRLNEAVPREDATGSHFVHGDFHYGQVLLDAGRDIILDFDRSYVGDPIADVGNFCAHVRLLEADGRISGAGDITDTFVRRYEKAAGWTIGREHLNFWTAFGVFQLAVRPFRTLETGWRGRIERALRICEQSMS